MSESKTYTHLAHHVTLNLPAFGHVQLVPSVTTDNPELQAAIEAHPFFGAGLIVLETVSLGSSEGEGYPAARAQLLKLKKATLEGMAVAEGLRYPEDATKNDLVDLILAARGE